MKEAYRDVHHTEVATGGDHALYLGRCQRNDDLTVRSDAFAHSDRIGTGYDVGRAPWFQCVQFRSRLAPNRQDVAETLGCDEDDARPAPFEKGIRGNGATVDITCGGRGALQDGGFRIRGGRQPLPGAHR